MKYIFSCFMLLLFISNIFAANDAYIISQTRSIKILPLYQSWTIDNSSTFSEVSIPVLLYFPVNRNLSLSLRGGGATASGDYLQTLSGLMDTQLFLNYLLEAYHLVISLGVNLPGGKKELTFNEFTTSLLLSYNYFNFLFPNFGQGLKLTPGITWAYPLTDNFVLGLGATYQYKGQFKPLQGMVDGYKPGNEILITGGIDVQLTAAANLSADLIYITYSADKISNNEVFASGDIMLANIQYRQYYNFNELRLFVRYRSKGKNSLAIAGALVPESQKTTPDQIEFMGSYRQRFSKNIDVSILAEGRFYLETPVFPGINIYGFGISPEIALISNLKVLMRFKYLLGKFKNGSDLSGLEAGLGVSCDF